MNNEINETDNIATETDTNIDLLDILQDIDQDGIDSRDVDPEDIDLENLDLDELDNLEELIGDVPDLEIQLEELDEKLLRQLENDGLGRYFKNISATALLSREQEFWLGVDVQTGKKLKQLTAITETTPGGAVLNNLFEDLKKNWLLIQRIHLAGIVSNYDWGSLMSKVASRNPEEPIQHPNDLFFLVNEVIAMGESGKEAAQLAVNFYTDLLLSPVKSLCRIPWNLTHNGDWSRTELEFVEVDQPGYLEWERVLERYDAAMEEFVLSNLRLVISVTKKYQGRGLDFEDLIQYGNLGLIRSIEKFNPCSGFRFSTYSHWWIRQSVSRAVADYSRTIRLPVHLHDKVASIMKVRYSLVQKLGRIPTDDEIINEHGAITEKEMKIVRVVSRDPLSLNDSPQDKNGSTLEDLIPDKFDLEDKINGMLLHEKLDDILNTLPPREKTIIVLRYGFSGQKPCTLDEVGSKMGVTRERIRQIEAQALARLRITIGKPRVLDLLIGF